MLSDFALPPGFEPPETTERSAGGVSWRAAAWTPEALGRLASVVAEGGEALSAVPPERRLAVWQETVAAFRDPDSPERRRLGPVLARLCRLSPEGLDAGLEAVLGGVAGEAAAHLFAEAAGRRAAPGPVLVLLASNLPALAVQPLLPALALGRSVISKSPTAEPLFAPAFVAALAAREPALGRAVAAVTWPGGHHALEAPLLVAASRVLAYGDRETLDDLGRRTGGEKLVTYGPKTSLAVISADADPGQAAPGLARDVALFDQRGCLSVAALYVERDAEAWAAALTGELARLAHEWPPGPAAPEAAGAVQRLRAEAALRGLPVWPLEPLGAGTVVVEPEPAFRPSPGLRTVRVHPLTDLAPLPEVLAPWRGRLQGVAWAGRAAETAARSLTSLDGSGLGISRVTPAGALQSPDALWHNGGAHPLTVLAG